MEREEIEKYSGIYVTQGLLFNKRRRHFKVKIVNGDKNKCQNKIGYTPELLSE